jgi:hypothetical protein
VLLLPFLDGGGGSSWATNCWITALTSLVGPARKSYKIPCGNPLQTPFRTFVVRPTSDVGAGRGPRGLDQSRQQMVERRARTAKNRPDVWTDKATTLVDRRPAGRRGDLHRDLVLRNVIDRFLAAHNPPAQGTRATNAR